MTVLWVYFGMSLTPTIAFSMWYSVMRYRSRISRFAGYECVFLMAMYGITVGDMIIQEKMQYSERREQLRKLF